MENRSDTKDKKDNFVARKIKGRYLMETNRILAKNDLTGENVKANANTNGIFFGNLKPTV